MAIVRLHLPRGYTLVERELPGSVLGKAREATGEIICRPIVDRDSLMVFLHECGHVHLKHWDQTLPRWREEYEADCYAIDAMKTAGLPVHRDVVRCMKAHVRDCIERASETIDDEVLRWAFGRAWRQHV